MHLSGYGTATRYMGAFLLLLWDAALEGCCTGGMSQARLPDADGVSGLDRQRAAVDAPQVAHTLWIDFS